MRSRFRRVSLALLVPLVLVACRPAVTGGLERRCREAGLAAPTAEAVGGLPNFGPVDDGFFRCAQPSRAGLLEAKRQGVRTVVSVRSAHSDEAMLAGTGLAYVRIAMTPWNPSDEQVARFLRIATDPGSRPVLLHCAQGQDRTGVLVAAYRRVVQGWSAEDALAELESYGASPLWSNLRTYVRTLDVDRMRALVAATPLPVARPVD